MGALQVNQRHCRPRPTPASLAPMQRRSFLALAAAACADPALAEAPPQTLAPPVPKPSELLGASGDANFLAWLDDFYVRQVAAGTDRKVLDREL